MPATPVLRRQRQVTVNLRLWNEAQACLGCVEWPLLKTKAKRKSLWETNLLLESQVSGRILRTDSCDSQPPQWEPGLTISRSTWTVQACGGLISTSYQWKAEAQRSSAWASQGWGAGKTREVRSQCREHRLGNICRYLPILFWVWDGSMAEGLGYKISTKKINSSDICAEIIGKISLGKVNLRVFRAYLNIGKHAAHCAPPYNCVHLYIRTCMCKHVLCKYILCCRLCTYTYILLSWKQLMKQ